MHENEKLNKSEWCVVLSVILLLGTITFISHQHWLTAGSQTVSDPIFIDEQKISAKIEGAVESPGIYHLEKGMTIEDLLLLAKPTVHADLQKVNLTRKIKDGQIIKIPALEFITIYLKGAVKCSEALILPKGTCLEDLIKLVEFQPGADLDKLKRNKRLRDGQTVKIQYQKKASSANLKRDFNDNE